MFHFRPRREVNMTDYKAHWSQVYQTKAPTDVSRYQTEPTLSISFIQGTGIGPDAPIIDVGAGASTLADHLLERGYRDLTVLDISAEALTVARTRLGERATGITWLEGDITTVALPPQHYAVWHDRAVFHFLTDPEARQRYVAQVMHAVRPGGHVIVATFAPDGPEKCSGLDVMRYDAQALHQVFGGSFELVNGARETHQTPWGNEQRFSYCYCRRAGNG
jgi:2-polyprenyl-3-methyl-5-hydroxy-6-metoxy-1,4-benzoquinol methylase